MINLVINAIPATSEISKQVFAKQIVAAAAASGLGIGTRLAIHFGAKKAIKAIEKKQIKNQMNMNKITVVKVEPVQERDLRAELRYGVERQRQMRLVEA